MYKRLTPALAYLIFSIEDYHYYADTDCSCCDKQLVVLEAVREFAYRRSRKTYDAEYTKDTSDVSLRKHECVAHVQRQEELEQADVNKLERYVDAKYVR